jgi:hypothetical protein
VASGVRHAVDLASFVVEANLADIQFRLDRATVAAYPLIAEVAAAHGRRLVADGAKL